MTDQDTTATESTEPKEFSVQIRISDKNLQYKSDFNEAETIFWLEAVKDLIIKNAFAKADLQKTD
jgi:hypothetical protein